MWPFTKSKKQLHAEFQGKFQAEVDKLCETLKQAKSPSPYKLRICTTADDFVYGYDTARKRNAAAAIVRNNLVNGGYDCFKDTDGRQHLIESDYVVKIGEHDE